MQGPTQPPTSPPSRPQENDSHFSLADPGGVSPCFIFIGCRGRHVLSPHPPTRRRPVSVGGERFTEGGDGSRAQSARAVPPPHPPRAAAPPRPRPEAPPPALPGPAPPSREGGDQAAAAVAGICWKPAGGCPGGAEGTVPAAKLAPRREGGWRAPEPAGARERWRPSGSTSSASS